MNHENNTNLSVNKLLLLLLVVVDIVSSNSSNCSNGITIYIIQNVS